MRLATLILNAITLGLWVAFAIKQEGLIRRIRKLER